MDVQGVMELMAKIEKRKELLKAVAETNDEVQQMLMDIKELQANIKTTLEADSEYAELQEEIKELTKELNAASKAMSKSLERQAVQVKPADLRSFLKKKLKSDEEVQKVIQTGSQYNVLKSAVGGN